jgi:hypothetical protein
MMRNQFVEAKKKITDDTVAKIADEITEGIMDRAMAAVTATAANITGSSGLHQRANNAAALNDMKRRWKMVTIRDRSKATHDAVEEFILNTYGDGMANVLKKELSTLDPAVEIPNSKLSSIFDNLCRYGLKNGVISIGNETQPDRPGALSPISGPQKNDKYGYRQDTDTDYSPRQRRQQQARAPFANRLADVFRDTKFTDTKERDAVWAIAKDATDAASLWDLLQKKGMMTVSAEIGRAINQAEKD